jgi:hypothetical protein
MDILQILQTIGICVGAVALVAIAILLFLVVSSVDPIPDEDAHPLRFLRGKSREEIHQLLTTPVYESPPRRKPRPKKDQPRDDKE